MFFVLMLAVMGRSKKWATCTYWGFFGVMLWLNQLTIGYFMMIQSITLRFYLTLVGLRAVWSVTSNHFLIHLINKPKRWRFATQQKWITHQYLDQLRKRGFAIFPIMRTMDIFHSAIKPMEMREKNETVTFLCSFFSRFLETQLMTIWVETI